MKKNKWLKIFFILLTLCVSFMFKQIPVKAANTSMPNGTVLIGNKSYDLGYVNDDKNLNEIRLVIISGETIYVKGFSGIWVENNSGKSVNSSIIPAATYKSITGVETKYKAADILDDGNVPEYVDPLLRVWDIAPPKTSGLNTNLRNAIMENFPNYGGYSHERLNGLKSVEFSEFTKSIALGANVDEVKAKILAMKWHETFAGGEGDYGVGMVKVYVFDDMTNNAYVISNKHSEVQVFGDTYIYYDASTKKNKVVRLYLNIYYNIKGGLL